MSFHRKPLTLPLDALVRGFVNSHGKWERPITAPSLNDLFPYLGGGGGLGRYMSDDVGKRVAKNRAREKQAAISRRRNRVKARKSRYGDPMAKHSERVRMRKERAIARLDATVVFEGMIG